MGVVLFWDVFQEYIENAPKDIGNLKSSSGKLLLTKQTMLQLIPCVIPWVVAKEISDIFFLSKEFYSCAKMSL